MDLKRKKDGALGARVQLTLDRFFVWSYHSSPTSHYRLNVEGISYKRNPAPDGHRCGVCPTYFRKICGFDPESNTTSIFDNHCIMDLYNCMEGTFFGPLNYEHCLYFGNFAYVHGTKYEDRDYDEDHITLKGSKKNPDFVRRH